MALAAGRGGAAAAGAAGGRARRALALAACLLLSVAWSVRLLSLHVEMRVAQHKVREDWAYVDDWIVLQRLDVERPPRARVEGGVARRTRSWCGARPASSSGRGGGSSIEADARPVRDRAGGARSSRPRALSLAAQAAEVERPDWWSDTRPRNAAEAAAFGRAADLVRLLRRGDHPEQIFPVRDGMIGESPAWVSVIEARDVDRRPGDDQAARTGGQP